MSGETFNQYRSLVGERASVHNLEQACDTLEQLRCKDLLSLLTIMSSTRSQDVSLASVVNGNRFHEPSSISQRLMHSIDGKIFQAMPDVEFIELAPLQPFGINAVLAGINEKNAVAALRRSEANADATTALFRVAFPRFNLEKRDTVRLASNVRTTRAQIFDPNTKFLPHFKVFAETSVGLQDENYGRRELEALSDHLATEVNIIQSINNLPNASINNIHIAVGNVLFIQDMISHGLVEETKVRANTTNPSYNLMEQSGQDIPEEIPLGTDNLPIVLKELGISRGAKVTDNFKSVVQERHPDLLDHLVLDLGRIAGLGYYKHIAYKISAENNDGIKLPLSDGGTTNWAEMCSSNKQLFCIASGIGTELLGAYFFDNEKT